MPAGPTEIESAPRSNRTHDRQNVGARVVAGDFRLVEAAEDYASLSARVIRGDDDIVVGPHYAYDTLVFALRETLRAVPDSGSRSP